jgi:hypothetical protein
MLYTNKQRLDSLDMVLSKSFVRLLKLDLIKFKLKLGFPKSV